MRFNQIIAAAAVAYGASSAVAIQHGDHVESNGIAYRWTQLAEGQFHGVPADEWDETVHIASDAAWDIEEIAARMFPGHDGSDGAMAARSLELESRNLADTCQAVASCIKFGAQYTLLAGVNAWITAAEYGALQVGKDLWSFLNAPFISTSLGVGIGGQIGGLGSGTECSTSSEAADVLGAVLNSQLANAPGTGNLSVQLTGPSGTWTITLMAGQPDVNFAPTC